MPPRRPCSAAATCRSTAGTIRRSSSPSPCWPPPFPMAGDLRSGSRLALRPIWLPSRAILPRSGDAAGRARFPGGLRQYRPRPERISHRGLARRRAALARSAAVARRRADRPARLQAAIRRADSAGAARGRTMEHHRRRRGDRRGTGRRQPRRARRRRLARLRGFHEVHADGGARTGRHRLGENPVDILGGADVGRGVQLAYAVQIAAGAQRSPQRWPGCGRATPRSNSRPRRLRPQACSRRPMCSITISWCWRSQSRSSRAMD